MKRDLEAEIRAAADKVLRLERELDQANEEYRELLDEADQRGIQVPRTRLTNPLMPGYRTVDRPPYKFTVGPDSAH
jgi:hypothetical protein